MSDRVLGDLADLTVGHVGPMASEYVDEGVPFIRSLNVRPFRIELEGVKYIPESFHQRLAKSALTPGDVVVVRTGAPGTAAVIPESLPVANCSDVVIVRPGPDLDSRYLAYLINSVARGYIDSRTVGAVQQHFNVGAAKGIPIPAATLDEQRRIASVLGALDELIETNRRLSYSIAEEQSTLFLDAWDGSTTRLGDVAQITMGQSPPGNSFNEDGIGTVFYQGVRDFGWRFPSNRVWTTDPKRMAEAGDILVAVRAPVGEINLATEPTGLGRGLGGVRAAGRQATTYAALSSTPDIWHIHQGTGTVFASINKQGMAGLEIPWVDDDGLERRLSLLSDAIRDLDEEIADLTRARDELLPLLMSGKVRVAEDLAVA